MKTFGIIAFLVVGSTFYSMNVLWCQGEILRYVDPFIGTEGEGNTFPGAALPFGMVKLGPDCGHMRANSGYIKGAPIIGFSHTHVSGTGGGAKYGNILVMPFSGELGDSIFAMPSHYEASPGYFAVGMPKYGVEASFAVTHGAGFHQYVFEERVSPKLLIDAGSFLGEGHCCGEAQELVGSQIRVVSEGRVEGYCRVRGGWNKGGVYTVYFAALLDQEADSIILRRADRLIRDEWELYDNGEKTAAFLCFGEDIDTLKVKVGISYISAQKAYVNLITDIPDWDMDSVIGRARGEWYEALSSVQIGAESEEGKTMFYSALYRTMLMPTDRTGENPLWASTEPYYDDFYAIWDTYRATNPLMILVQPERARDIVRSLIDTYRMEGYMPDSRSGNHTGRTQGGSNCDMVVAEAILKGLDSIDLDDCYAAMTTNAEIPPGGDQQKEGRGGINDYIRLGYVPAEYEPDDKRPELHIPKLYPRAGTRTVEYAANDGAIALVAKQLGKDSDYRKYKNRAGNWANLWNGHVEEEGVQGFIWPKRKDGSWVLDYSVDRYGSWGNFMYEASTWEYSHYVPHDVSSLVDSCGGAQRFVSRLDTFFENNHFQVSNEPSFLTPCLYNYVGRQDKSSERVRAIIRDNYTADPDGIPGNDDAGSMSAWLVFHMMGFFPNAGQDVYLISAPHFSEVTLAIGHGAQLNLIAHDLSEENKYIQRVLLNGEPLDQSWFRHEQIEDGATIEFVMGSQPNNSWEKNYPPSMSDGD